MSVRFQADADFSQKILAGVLRREPAVDFRTAADAGLSGRNDREVLTIAASAGRVLVTHDVKTMPRHFADFIASATSPGVVVIPQSMPIGVAVENLLLIWSATEPEEWVNRLYIVPR